MKYRTGDALSMLLSTLNNSDAAIKGTINTVWLNKHRCHFFSHK